MPILSEGMEAPDFTALDQNAKEISLYALKGRKVVLYFYPQDDTPTCTVEACNLRDNYSILKKKGFEVIGVSPDNDKKHKKFQQKYQLPFTLLSDPDHKIMEAYGVWGPKKLFGVNYTGVLRHTFLIDEKGVIRKILTKVKSRIHSDQILEGWKELEH